LADDDDHLCSTVRVATRYHHIQTHSHSQTDLATTLLFTFLVFTSQRAGAEVIKPSQGSLRAVGAVKGPGLSLTSSTMRNLRNICHKVGKAPSDITATCWDPSKDEVLITCGPTAPDHRIELLRVVDDVSRQDPAFPL
jgi:hypothetical protein